MNKPENVIVVLHIYLHKFMVCSCVEIFMLVWTFLKSEGGKLEKNKKASNQEWETTSIYEEMKFTDTFQLYDKHIWAITHSFI